MRSFRSLSRTVLAAVVLIGAVTLVPSAAHANDTDVLAWNPCTKKTTTPQYTATVYTSSKVGAANLFARVESVSSTGKSNVDSGKLTGAKWALVYRSTTSGLAIWRLSWNDYSLSGVKFVTSRVSVQSVGLSSVNNELEITDGKAWIYSAPIYNTRCVA